MVQFQMGAPVDEQHQRERRHRTFRVVPDFLSLRAAEIGPCLRSFQEWLQRSQSLRAEAVRDGIDPASLNFAEFTWHARTEPSAQRPATPYAPETPIQELDLRPSAMHKMREQNLLALEDFTEASEDELLAMPNVGRATVVQIRSYLQAIGLDFRESRHPERRAGERAKIARRLPPEQRRVTGDASIAELGLKPPTVSRCMAKGINTIGALRAMTLRDLWVGFGVKSVQEVMETLDSVGLELVSKPTQLEKWRRSAITKDKLKLPAEDAPIAELEPWLGAAATGALAEAGITTIAQARALAVSGRTKVRGMGEHAWARVYEHFGVRPEPAPARAAGRRTAGGGTRA